MVTYDASGGFYVWARTTHEVEAAGYVGGLSSPPPDQSNEPHRPLMESHVDVQGFDPTPTSPGRSPGPPRVLKRLDGQTRHPPLREHSPDPELRRADSGGGSPMRAAGSR